ncbi:MAG TPA: MBL fold metallo-hydrolase [Allosphingosinicella sp.]|nr:MBL fold metallo-hydrolase [Allosphingosinicella sp.]
MKLTFVGHASILLQEGDVGLLMDPWLQGDAFNDSWSLFPPAVLHDWESVTHIWISHEHPDHLSIPTIKSIPADAKSKIVMLFQKHYDEQVLSWLNAQGFKEVREMPHGKWLPLGPDFKAACFQVGHTDSALAVRAGGHTLLNVNDCDLPVSSLKRMKRKLGHVDLLMDQFSIAGWPGNPDDVERRKGKARAALERFVLDVKYLDPDFVLPFASFVRFSHQENAYMNTAVNTVSDVASLMEPDRLVVMYPGDTWTLGDDHSQLTDNAIRRYAEALESSQHQALRSHDKVPMDQIISAANARLQDFQTHYHRSLLKRIPPVTFYVKDLDKAFKVDVASHAEEIGLPEKDCILSLSSQAAHHTFKMRFGLPTLGVSGRYSINHSEPAFLTLKKLGSAYSSGFYTKKLPAFGIKPRLFEFFWRRKSDLASQFLARIRPRRAP